MINKKNKKVSVCITTFNEKASEVNVLISSLKNQTLKPDEIIIIDAKDFDNCSRSKGRNIAIRKARNEIIALTDVGSVPNKDWLYKITRPFFENSNVDVVAGGYKMIYKNNFQKACSIFLGVNERQIDDNFMPSARSMAITRSAWKKVKGFPESLNDTAEDTVFDLLLINAGYKIVVIKDAIVSWPMPKNIIEFTNKIYKYAKGDAVSKIWWHPVKKWKTHNIKVLTIILRYIIFIYFPWLLIPYILYAYLKSNLWGVLLQIVSDFAVIIGFSHGILQTSFKRN